MHADGLVSSVYGCVPSQHCLLENTVLDKQAVHNTSITLHSSIPVFGIEAQVHKWYIIMEVSLQPMFVQKPPLSNKGQSL